MSSCLNFGLGGGGVYFFGGVGFWFAGFFKVLSPQETEEKPFFSQPRPLLPASSPGRDTRWQRSPGQGQRHGEKMGKKEKKKSGDKKKQQWVSNRLPAGKAVLLREPCPLHVPRGMPVYLALEKSNSSHCGDAQGCRHTGRDGYICCSSSPSKPRKAYF